MMRYAAIVSHMTGQSWAMHGPVLDAAVTILCARMLGEPSDPQAVSAVIAERDRRQDVRRAEWGDYPSTTPTDEERGYFHAGGVAVVPVSGVLAKYGDMVNGMSQPSGMTTSRVADIIARAAADRRSTAGLLLDIDSPGGTVAGVDAMAGAVRDARAMLEADGRQVIALSRDAAYSAAYWLACQASEVWMSGPVAGVGSMGVFAVVQDTSAVYEGRGVKRLLLASGPHKGAFAEGTKVTAEHISERMHTINAEAMAFKRAVAEGRGMPLEQVEELATGRVFIGEEAVDAGLADGLATFGEIVQHMNAR